jgi:Mg-chelatase subunit ChlD
VYLVRLALLYPLILVFLILGFVFPPGSSILISPVQGQSDDVIEIPQLTSNATQTAMEQVGNMTVFPGGGNLTIETPQLTSNATQTAMEQVSNATQTAMEQVSNATQTAMEQVGNMTVFPGGGNLTANNGDYLEYPGRSFSVEYPQSWALIPFEIGMPGSETIRIVNRELPAIIMLLVGPLPGSTNASKAFVDTNLEKEFPSFVKGLISGITQGKITELEEPVYNRHIIDGHRAGTLGFTSTYGETTFRNIFIGTMVGKNGVGMTYSARADVFDQYLPIFENIVKSVKLTQTPGTNKSNVTTIRDIDLNGIWKRDDGEQLIITQQGPSVIAGFPTGKGTCENSGLIGEQFESDFDFKGIIENGKVVAEQGLCYNDLLNQSQTGAFLDKANYTIKNGGTVLEGFIQNRFSGEYQHGRYDKVDKIQPIDLNLKADKKKYEFGQIVHLTGMLSNRLPLSNQTVLVQIFDPIGQGYESQNVIINSDNSYSYDLDIKNATRKGTFKAIATYSGFGDTINFEFGVPSTPIPSFFKPVALNNTNVTTIKGTPTTVSLFYNDGQLATADNVEYKIKFDVPGQKFQISGYDKGTFDNVKKISNDTLVFNTSRILKNENKTGLVVFTFGNNSVKDKKLVAYSDVTVNGTTQKTVIDPGLTGIVEIGTKIFDLAEKGFKLGLNFYNEFVACVKLDEIPTNEINPTKKLEIKSCSNHPQKTQLIAFGLPSFIRPHFDPKDFDINSNETTNSDLTLEVKNNTLTDKREFWFNVTSDVVYNVFGQYYEATDSETEVKFTLEPKLQKEPVSIGPPVTTQPVKIDCSSADKSANSPEVIRNIQHVSTNDRSLKNETPLDNLGTPDINLMQVCVIGYDKISEIRSPMDIVFSIDSSPSMEESDKDNLRISAAKSFIDLLDPTTDKAGIITWGREIASQTSLTSDFSFLKSNLDKIELVGGTNLDAGLRGGVELLEGNNNSNQEFNELFEENSNINSNQEFNRTKVIVFLSDGNGQYTRSNDPDSITQLASAKGYKIFTVGLNIDNSTAERDLKDIATATGGIYYPSPVAENLNDIYGKIFQNIVTKEFPKDLDLIITIPKEGIKVTGFNIQPSEISEGNKSLTWKNISQNVGNKDNFLGSDENVLVTFNIEGLSSNDNPVGTLNYTDTDEIKRSVPNEVEGVSIPKPPLG